MIEVGGNWGWDVGNFLKFYNMNYFILELLIFYIDIFEKKFVGNEKVSIYNVGFGLDNEVVMVNFEGNNVCVMIKFLKKNGIVFIYIVNVIDFLIDLGKYFVEYKKFFEQNVCKKVNYINDICFKENFICIELNL